MNSLILSVLFWIGLIIISSVPIFLIQKNNRKKGIYIVILFWIVLIIITVGGNFICEKLRLRMVLFNQNNEMQKNII